MIKLFSKDQVSTLSLRMSRTLLNNDDALLEFRTTWRFLIGAGVYDHILDVFFGNNKLKFQVFEKSVMFKVVKNPPEE